MEASQGREILTDDRKSILRACFDYSSAVDKPLSDDFVEYLEIYEAQSPQLDFEVIKTAEKKWPFEKKADCRIAEVVELIRDLGSGATLSEVQQAVRGSLLATTICPSSRELAILEIDNGEENAVTALIYASLRMWLLVNFRIQKFKDVFRQRPIVHWRRGATLGDTLKSQFKPSTTELTLEKRRLHPHFTVANMIGICGLKIRWAETLDDHLRLDRHKKELWIFNRRKWLLSKQRSAEESSFNAQPDGSKRLPSAPLPVELYEETNRTLDLLFPTWDKATRRLLESGGKTFRLHYFSSQDRVLDLNQYSYWRDRLLELNEDIFLAPPEGWTQLWRDRRDPQKFWTFWLMLSVFTMTIVSTVASVLQAAATLKASPL